MTDVHFSVTGEFMTEHARDRIFERGWEDGLRFLTTSLIGFGLDNAVAVLKGEKRLIGVNVVDLEDEEPAVTVDLGVKLRRVYAGTVFDGSRYLRPYAYVDNWGWLDIDSQLHGKVYERALSFLCGSGDSIQKNKTSRSVRYADDPINDVLKPLEVEGRPVVVLWSEVPAVPVWSKVFFANDWQSALDDYLSATGRLLEHRGHHQWFGREEPPAWLCMSQPEPEVRSYEPPAPPDPITDLERAMGWVTPNGRFYPADWGHHKAVAESIWFHLLGGKATSTGEDDGTKAGWVKFFRFDNRVEMHHDGKRPMTTAQRRTVEDWHIANGRELPDGWND